MRHHVPCCITWYDIWNQTLNLTTPFRAFPGSRCHKKSLVAKGLNDLCILVVEQSNNKVILVTLCMCFIVLVNTQLSMHKVKNALIWLLKFQGKNLCISSSVWRNDLACCYLLYVGYCMSWFILWEADVTWTYPVVVCRLFLYLLEFGTVCSMVQCSVHKRKQGDPDCP